MNPAAPLDNVILAKNDNNTIDCGIFYYKTSHLLRMLARLDCVLLSSAPQQTWW